MTNRLNQACDVATVSAFRMEGTRSVVAVASSPLLKLAKVISACPAQDKTPVLVCGRSIVLADDFYIALCEAVRVHTGRGVRLDFLPGHPLVGFLARLLRRRHLNRLNARLSGLGSVSSTIALSRNHSLDDELTIGFAGLKDELPSYAKPIELAA